MEALSQLSGVYYAGHLHIFSLVYVKSKLFFCSFRIKCWYTLHLTFSDLDQTISYLMTNRCLMDTHWYWIKLIKANSAKLDSIHFNGRKEIRVEWQNPDKLHKAVQVRRRFTFSVFTFTFFNHFFLVHYFHFFNFLFNTTGLKLNGEIRISCTKPLRWDDVSLFSC